MDHTRSNKHLEKIDELRSDGTRSEMKQKAKQGQFSLWSRSKREKWWGFLHDERIEKTNRLPLIGSRLLEQALTISMMVSNLPEMKNAFEVMLPPSTYTRYMCEIPLLASSTILEIGLIPALGAGLPNSLRSTRRLYQNIKRERSENIWYRWSSPICSIYFIELGNGVFFIKAAKNYA